MRFFIEELEVFFPYDYLYKEQYDYMYRLKIAISEKRHALLEMPTGTGKTVCLLSLITSYQFQYPLTGKLIYCTRTVPEMVKCMDEIKKVIAYRTKVLGAQCAAAKILALCLSSRRNMCIHPTVMAEGDRDTVDSSCRSMTASWVRSRPDVQPENLCGFYESYYKDGTSAEVPTGVYSLDDMKVLGSERGWCPYFMARHLLHQASIVVYNYQYMLDPKVASLVSRELEKESIVVFDEAHNIDNVCIEALSVALDKRKMEAAVRGVGQLQRKVAHLKATDAAKLRSEYDDLVRGLGHLNGGMSSSLPSSSSSLSSSSSSSLLDIADATRGTPILTDDILREAIPGNIRKAEHFITFLKKVVLFLRDYLRDCKDVEMKTPLAFLRTLQDKTYLERKPLRFTHHRLHSLLRTLEVTTLDEFTGLTDAANFVTLLATYAEGFSVILEPQGTVMPGVTEPLLQLCCLDSSIAIRPVMTYFKTVIITSGTLSPLDLYPKLLDFQPVICDSLPMSVFRNCLKPLIVTKGSDQLPISTRFELREDISVIRNYGALLLDVARNVPDGICCFFTSYKYMEDVVATWDEMKILQKVVEHKLLFIETKDVVETTLALDNFKRACDSGRGAIFFSIARGKVAEGVDFDMHFGRCVILFGIPYQYTKSLVLRARLDFLREKHQIKDNDFLTFDAMRQASQCIGRVIRSKTDYGLVILADSRYARNDKRSKLPPWVTQFLIENSVNISVDVANSQMKQFLREMGQPVDRNILKSILFSEEEIKRRLKKVGGTPGGSTPGGLTPSKQLSLGSTPSRDIGSLTMPSAAVTGTPTLATAQGQYIISKSMQL